MSHDALEVMSASVQGTRTTSPNEILEPPVSNPID